MSGEGDKVHLQNRRHALLLATVQEFIATALPVGSQQLAAHHSLGVRAAMVRNIMSELEQVGYLEQPHTSAGRVPTDKAFRYYVDSLMPSRRIDFEDRAQIELHYSERARDHDEIIRDTPRLLALLTGQAAMLMTPRLGESMLERVNFVRLREKTVLVVFVATAGSTQSRLITTDVDHTQDELDRMAAYLDESLQGRTLDQARKWIERQLKEARSSYDRFMRAALTLGESVAGQAAGQAQVYVDGSLRALEQPEFADRRRMRELLRALDDKTALLELLERSLKRGGIMVSIGSENHDARLAGFTVIAAAYDSGSTPLGSLAVVGPVRMDYDRVIPLVDYTARTLSRLLEH